jgi:hypothetical protein
MERMEITLAVFHVSTNWLKAEDENSCEQTPWRPSEHTAQPHGTVRGHGNDAA